MTKKILYLGLDPSHSTIKDEITHCPIIQIVPRAYDDVEIQTALTLFPQFTHIILTSKSPIRILHEYLLRFGYPLSLWKEKQTIVVGKATAKSLFPLEIIPTAVASNETAEGVVETLKFLSLDSSWCFWPHSTASRNIIPSYFHENNLKLTDSIFYETQMKVPSKLPDLNTFDEIIFTSPSTIDAFLKIFGEIPENKELVAIGPVTFNYLKKHSLALFATIRQNY